MPSLAEMPTPFVVIDEGVMRAAYRRAGEDGYVDEVMMARLLD